MIVVAIAAMCGGCASVTRGTSDDVQILSEPAGADVRISTGQTCITPCTLRFGRKDEFTVTASKPGYHTSEMPVTTKIAGAGAAGFAGNVLVGGVIGMAVDAASGATLEHYPNPVMMTLVPLHKGEPARVIKQEPPVQVPARSPGPADESTPQS